MALSLNMTDKNILHLCSYYVGSKVYKELFQHLAKISNIKQQHVFVPVRAAKHIGQNSFSDNVVKFHYTQVLNLITKLSFIAKQWRIKHAFSRFYRQHASAQYTCVHAHTLYADGILAWHIYKSLKIPYVITVRASDVSIFNKIYPHWEGVIKKVLCNARSVIFISPSHKVSFEKKYFSITQHSILLPNGIDKYWIENALAEHPAEQLDVTHGLYIGIINRNKNLSRAIDAFFSADCTNHKRKMTIIGGDYENYLKIYGPMNKKNLKNVEFVGKIKDRNKLRQYFRQANVFIMPSHIETFGLVYLEAISQCTPVIYSENQGIDGLFEEGEVGFSCQPRSSASIRKAIEQVFVRYPNGLKFNSVKHNPVNQYTWHRVAEILVDEIYT